MNFSHGFTLFAYAIISIVTMVVFSIMLNVLLPAGILLNAVPSSHAQNISTAVDIAYYTPSPNSVNTLSRALNATGVYGFVFNTSQTPDDKPYATYNWCNMPHVRKQEYKTPPAEYRLKYVEVIHRHHKRTPYAANTFPVETQNWDCSNAALYTYGQPNIPNGNKSAPAYWQYYESSINPYIPAGFPPHTCAFPQITRQGLDDSYQHGKDLYGVYHDLLSLIPTNDPLSATTFRVTNNPITSEVAGMLLSGMFGDAVTSSSVPLLIQAPDVDSLEPSYTCTSATNLFSSYGSGSTSPAWQRHLTDTSSLFSALDAISGVSHTASDWHVSYDHYFDNLSSRLCHQYPLPCNATFTPEQCVRQSQANEVFRMGEYEYAFIYRSAGNQTLEASKASFGIWVAELANHLRASSAATAPLRTVYRHNVAHDGSLARLLSILQLDEMVWPGMGSEVVFELYSHGGDDFVRILWSGQPLRSSSPTLQAAEDMIPLPRLLGYFDGLVGRNASLITALCAD